MFEFFFGGGFGGLGLLRVRRASGFRVSRFVELQALQAPLQHRNAMTFLLNPQP